MRANRTHLFLLALSVGIASGSLRSEEKGLLELVPGDVIGYVHVESPAATLEGLRRSEFFEKFRDTIVYRQIEQDEGFGRLQEGLKRIESGSGQDAVRLLERLASGGGVLAARLSFPPEFFGIFRSADAATLRDGVASLRKLVEAEHGELPEGREVVHEGKSFIRLGPVTYCVLGDTLVLSSSELVVRDIIDLSTGKSDRSVVESKNFAEAFASPEREQTIASAAVLPRFVPGFLDNLPSRADNFVASMLLGGWLETLRHSGLLHARLEHGANGLALEVRSRVGEESAADLATDIFFPESTDASELRDLRRLRAAGMLAVAHLRRDLARWWERKDSFVDEKGQRQLVEFTNVMNLIFGGRPFEDEVLPRFGQGVTLVSRKVSFDNLASVPQPALPGFAAILRLKEADDFRRSLRAGFQSIVGFINVQRAQQGKDGTFLIETEKVGDVEVYTATADVPTGAGETRLGIEHNFSPSLTIVGPRVILSSSKELARELARVLQDGQAGASKTSVAPARAPTDTLRIGARRLAEVLRMNHEVIVTKTVLDEGIGRDEAAARLEAVDEVLGLLDALHVRTQRHGPTTTLRVQLQLAGDDAKEETQDTPRGTF